jgi:ribonucleoside-diphosphate reductase alpha chain
MRIPAFGGSAELHQGLGPVSQKVWTERFRRASDASVDETWRRVAAAVAAAEASPFMQRRWAQVFYQALLGFKFLPGGRTLAGAGAGPDAILFDCFINRQLPADASSILAHLQGAAWTMRRGGRVVQDYSDIPPKGRTAPDSGARPSGPLAIMDVWRAIAANIVETDVSSIAALSCSHPDIESFVSEAPAGRLGCFNRLVLIPDAFMAAVESDGGWPLLFGEETFRRVSARRLWRAMLQRAYDRAGLGLIFLDRATVPNGPRRGLQGAAPANDNAFGYDACLLGSINLAALVEDAFTPAAHIPKEKLDELASVAVRFLDNVIDASGYATPEQEAAAKARRRLGLGVTGLADALIMCGAHYGGEDGRRLAGRWMARIRRNAYLTSAGLARLKGCFPLFDMDEQLSRALAAGLDAEVSEAIRKHGLRNDALMAIAPTIATSLLADNISGGIEPVNDFAGSEGAPSGYAERRFRELRGPGALPSCFVSGRDVAPQARLEMQSAIQRHVDAPLGSVINCPPSLSFEDFEQLCSGAYAIGASGCGFFGCNRDERPTRLDTPSASRLANSAVM